MSNIDIAKTWRSWKAGEAPKYFMARHQRSGEQRVVHSYVSNSYLSELFNDYDWLHEDGTTTPCGVLEQ